jgi:hypothetical protein
MTDDLPPPAEELLRDHSCDDDDLPDLPTEASCADDDDGERVARISSIDTNPPFPFEHPIRSVSAESAMSEYPDLPGESTCGEDDDDSVRRRSSTHKSTLIEFTRRFNFPGGASSTADSNIPAATLRVFKDDDGAVHSQHTSGVDSIV